MSSTITLASTLVFLALAIGECLRANVAPFLFTQCIVYEIYGCAISTAIPALLYVLPRIYRRQGYWSEFTRRMFGSAFIGILIGLLVSAGFAITTRNQITDDFYTSYGPLYYKDGVKELWTKGVFLIMQKAFVDCCQQNIVIFGILLPFTVWFHNKQPFKSMQSKSMD